MHTALVLAQGAGDVRWGTLLMGLFGGLALFLLGMDRLTDELKNLAGDRLKVGLARLTTNRFSGALTGAFVTAIIQSSSVTTVLAVGFISAGLLSFSQSLGIIFGANVGTTVTAQVIAFKVTTIALLMIAVGFALHFLGRVDAVRQWGGAILGLGLVFFGMTVMGDAMEPLRDYQRFIDLMREIENPFLGILVGAAFTALIQSSSATTAVVIVMAGQGLISLEAGIALVLGANVGTSVTAMLAAIGKPREARRAAVAHLMFNTIGVLLWLGFVAQLADLVEWMSPAHPTLSGTARLAAEVPRQVANAHTVFNVANTVIFLLLATQFARLVERLVPDLPLPEVEEIRPRYLDDTLLGTVPLALDRVRLEIAGLGSRVDDMLAAIFPAMLDGGEAALAGVEEMDDAVDIMHGHIIDYLGRLSRGSLSAAQTEEVIRLFRAANDLEAIGDVIETNLVSLGRERLQGQIVVSPATREVLRGFYEAVRAALAPALRAITERDEEAAQEVFDFKERFARLADDAARHQVQRLVAAEPKRVATYRIEIDMIANLRRLYYYVKRMAKMALPAEVREAIED